MTIPRRRQSRWLWGLLILALVVVVGRTVLQTIGQRRGAPSPARLRQRFQRALQQDNAQLPVYGEVPDFALVDQRGQPVTRHDLLGHVWIADFIFTRCAGQCPMMTAQMAELARQLPSEARFVSLSVDPTHDAPNVLADYAASHGALSEQWRFVTGSPEAIYRLSTKGFHLSVEPQGGTAAEPIIHSARFVLVDQTGRIRGYYDGTDAEAVSRLLMDATALVRATAS